MIKLPALRRQFSFLLAVLGFVLALKGCKLLLYLLVLCVLLALLFSEFTHYMFTSFAVALHTSMIQ